MKYTVSSLVRYLKDELETDQNLSNIEITGELSNVKQYDRYMFFTLKDDTSAISSAMFYPYYQTLKFKPKIGDKVDIIGSITVYEKSGSMQLACRSIKLSGVGDLHEQFEVLKKKLAAEGYFDDDHKKSVPVLYPEKVAVLVGEDSAAMSDIKICFRRRWPLATVDYFPCLVQGEKASKDIILNLKKVDKLNYDYIILARGGGSFEDLFCFNDEELVKTIYNLNTFIVTGIGHEQDFTLADFAADLRAATPTASVEITTPMIEDVYIEIQNLKDSLFSSLSTIYKDTKKSLDLYLTNIVSYSNKLKLILNNINNCVINLNNAINHIFNNYKNNLNNVTDLLKAYSLDSTLKRGFSIVYKNNKIINNSNNLNENDDITIKMYKGNVSALIKEKLNG